MKEKSVVVEKQRLVDVPGFMLYKRGVSYHLYL